MMRYLVQVGQWMPPRIRFWVNGSPLAPLLRRVFNRVHPGPSAVVELAGSLSGHRMRLDWQTQKGFAFGTYEPAVCNLLQELVRPGWIVADVGAHIGYYALLLAHLVGSAGRVYAIEPHPANLAVLEENVALNGYQNIVVEPKAAGSSQGTRYLRVLHDDPRCLDSRVLPGEGTLTREFTDIPVEVVSLDDYFAACDERLDLVKIDVEGGEVHVLEGMGHILHSDRPFIVMELHGFDRWDERHPAWQHLIRARYRVNCLGKRSTQAHVLARPCGSSDWANELAVTLAEPPFAGCSATAKFANGLCRFNRRPIQLI